MVLSLYTAAVAWSLYIVVETDVAASLEMAAVIACGSANPGHPRFVVAPSTCLVPSCSSAVEPAGAVYVDTPIDALANDAPCIHSASLGVFPCKKTVHLDNSLCHS